MALLDPSGLPDTSLGVQPQHFYLDGLNQITSAEVYRVKMPFSGKLTGFGFSMDFARVAGLLNFQVLKNGSPVSGGFFQVNATFPTGGNVTGLNELYAIDDILTVEITTVAFSPLINTGSFYLITK